MVLVGALARDLLVEPIFFKSLPVIEESFESLVLIDVARGDLDLGLFKAVARGDLDRSLSPPTTRACGDLDLRLSLSKSVERDDLEESLRSLGHGDLDLGLLSAYKKLGHGDFDLRLPFVFNSLGRGDFDLCLLSSIDWCFFGLVVVSLVFFFFLVVSVSMLLDLRDPSTFGGPSFTGLYTIFRFFGFLVGNFGLLVVVSGATIMSNSLGGPPLDGL